MHKHIRNGSTPWHICMDAYFRGLVHKLYYALEVHSQSEPVHGSYKIHNVFIYQV